MSAADIQTHPSKINDTVTDAPAQKPLCIYHGNCADGFAAAWVFRRAFGEGRCDFHAGVYSEPPPPVVGRKVFMTDFSYKRPVVESMMRDAQSIMLVDHHETAIKDLHDVPGLGKFCSLDHSGAMLAWRFCFGNTEPPQLLRHIEDRDLWRFKLPRTREIQAALFSYPYDFDVWDRLMDLPIEMLAEEGESIERKHFKDIHELLAVTKRRMYIAGYYVPVANLPYTMSSDAGAIMAKGELFAACYYDTPVYRCFSLRSEEGGRNVAEIAALFGGGGHKHSAGFRVSHEELERCSHNHNHLRAPRKDGAQ